MDSDAHGFFYARRQLKIDAPEASGLADYPNVSRVIGAVVSAKMATMRELDENYSLEDVYDMLEVVAVDAHNRRIVDKRREWEGEA